MKSTTCGRLAEQAIFFPPWGERPTFFFHYYSFVFNFHFFSMKQFLKKFWLCFKFPRINSLPLSIAQWDTGLYLHLQDHTVLLLSCFSSKKAELIKQSADFWDHIKLYCPYASFWSESSRSLISLYCGSFESCLLLAWVKGGWVVLLQRKGKRCSGLIAHCRTEEKAQNLDRGHT